MSNDKHLGVESNGNVFLYKLHRLFGAKRPTIAVSTPPSTGFVTKDVYVSHPHLAGVYRLKYHALR